jgi:hypothetical protein
VIGLVAVAGVCALIAFFAEWSRSSQEGPAQVVVPAIASCAAFAMVMIIGYFILGIR